MDTDDLTDLQAAIAAAEKARDHHELALKLQLARHPALEPAARVTAMLRAAVCSDRMGDRRGAHKLAAEALEFASANNLPCGRAEALSELGVQARYAEDLPRSEALLRESAGLAASAGDKRLLARARANLAITLRRACRADLAHDEGQAAARLYRELGDLVGVNRMLHLQAQVRADQGLLDDARALLEEVLGLDAMTGDNDGRARSLGNLALVLDRQGNHEEAIARLREALELFEKLDAPAEVARALNNLAGSQLHLCRPQEALRTLQQAVERAGSLGNSAELARAYSRTADAMLMLGRLDEAEEMLAASEAATPLPSSVVHRNSLAHARLALLREDPAAALRHAEQAEQRARDAEELLNLAKALRLKAAAMLALGQGEAGRVAAAEGIEFLDAAQAGRTREYLKCVALAARIEQDLGNSEQARFLAEEGEALRKELEVDADCPDAELRRVVEELHSLASQA